MQMNLFERELPQPLAARLRPKTLDEFVGQRHLLGKNGVLRRLIENDQVGSMIFWGPPGVGKTTLARIIAARSKSRFVDFSAVTSGIREIREVMQQAEQNRQCGERTILFVDEIHRFNKAQQDAFLPYVEKGSILLIGATTENPSFEINAALLSRCKVFVLKALTAEDIERLLRNALSSEEGFARQVIHIEDRLLRHIAVFANGDARTALNTLEIAVLNGDMNEEGETTVAETLLSELTGIKALLYDKNGEEHYNLISALHKSMRNSDPDAAVYWLSRMLEAGEDPLYVARRVARFASEDIGMADPEALRLCMSVYDACHAIGMPECTVHLTEAVVYCSLSPKSNALYMAYEAAKEDARQSLAEPVPMEIRNAPTELMKQLGYGDGYQYAHDYEEKLTTLQCLPENLRNRRYYLPTEQGREKELRKRLEEIREWKKRHRELENK